MPALSASRFLVTGGYPAATTITFFILFVGVLYMIPLAAEFKAFGNLGKFQNQYYPNFPGNRQQDPCRKVSVQDGGQNVNTDMKLNFKIEFQML